MDSGRELARGTERRSPAGRPGSDAGWRETYERLSAPERGASTPTDLDLLADTLFWLDRPAESIVVRRDAYAAHVAAGELVPAALAAWMLFYDHHLVGEVTVAGGWLERARRHAAEAGEADSVPLGWVAVAEADWALAHGDPASALRHAQHATRSARVEADPDLTAMALQAEGRSLIATGDEHDGLSRLDEAMVAVISGELAPLFTGWIYCNVLSACHGLADLRRAADWCDAAMRWCEELRDGHLYPGLCRIYAADLACLRGAWDPAEADARRACEELTSHDPRYAGEAYYLAGEICRLRGDLDAAEEAFTQAHELGRLPQPGLALVRLAQGRAPAAAKALRSALHPGPDPPLERARLLAALAEVEVAVGEPAAARAAADELAAISGASTSPYLGALAAAADGAVLLTRDDPGGALVRLREACTVLRGLDLPYETARAQTALAVASSRIGDDDTATLELRAARKTFEQLGAIPDADRTTELLESDDTRPPTPLSTRELEVLRLVARGATNREIATELFVSEHTVARHVSNIFTKAGVSSRAGATAYAYEHELV